MKKLLLLILMLWSVAYGQTTGYFRYDTIRMQKGGGNSELIIENATRTKTLGVLRNIGGGKVEFSATVDSVYKNASADSIVYIIMGVRRAFRDSSSANSYVRDTFDFPIGEFIVTAINAHRFRVELDTFRLPGRVATKYYVDSLIAAAGATGWDDMLAQAQEQTVDRDVFLGTNVFNIWHDDGAGDKAFYISGGAVNLVSTSNLGFSVAPDSININNGGASSVDTSKFKPLATSPGGGLVRMSYWPGGGSTPTGTANTVAFYNGAGSLAAGSSSFGWDGTILSMPMGHIQAQGDAANYIGNSAASSYIKVSGSSGDDKVEVFSLNPFEVTGGIELLSGSINLNSLSSTLQMGGSAGTSGQVLTSAGIGARPTWSTPSVSVGNITGLGTNVGTFLATPSSANFFSAITDETGGTGVVVGSVSPAITGSATMVNLSTSGNLLSLAAFGTSSTIANGNIETFAGSAASATVSALAGSTSTNWRTRFGGATNSTITAGNSMASLFINGTTITEAASGTHPLFTQIGIKPLTITAGAGSLTNSASLYIEGAATGATNNYSIWSAAGVNRFDGGVLGTSTNDAATAGNVGEEINGIVSTYTNYTTTATYQNITSVTLTAGDWDLSAFMTYSSNSATITAASNAIFVISTTTASAAGATEGRNISYLPQAALLGTSLFSESIAPYRVSINATTTYYLNSQATFTLGNPQYVGGLRARRVR